MGRGKAKLAKREKVKFEKVDFRIPVITTQNIRDYVAADVTSKVGKVSAAQLESLRSTLGNKQAWLAKQLGKPKGPSKKGQGDAESAFVVFKLKQMCRIRCTACAELLRSAKTATNAKQDAEGQLGSSVAVNARQGSLWCLPCYERHLLDAVRQQEAPLHPERAAARGREPQMYGAFLTPEERQRTAERQAAEAASKKLQRKQRQRKNRRLRKQKKGPEAERPGVKEVAAVDPQAGLERRARRAAVDAKARRQGAVQARRQEAAAEVRGEADFRGPQP